MNTIYLKLKKYSITPLIAFILLFLSTITVSAWTYNGLYSLITIGTSDKEGRLVISNGINSLFTIGTGNAIGNAETYWGIYILNALATLLLSALIIYLMLKANNIILSAIILLIGIICILIANTLISSLSIN